LKAAIHRNGSGIKNEVLLYESIPMAVRSGVGLPPLACRDCGFESRRGHRSLSLVNVMCCTGRDLCDGPIPRPEESYRV